MTQTTFQGIDSVPTDAARATCARTAAGRPGGRLLSVPTRQPRPSPGQPGRWSRPAATSRHGRAPCTAGASCGQGPSSRWSASTVTTTDSGRSAPGRWSRGVGPQWLPARLRGGHAVRPVGRQRSVVVINRGRVDMAGSIARRAGGDRLQSPVPGHDSAGHRHADHSPALGRDVERGRVPVRVRWTAEDAESGIARLEAVTRTDDGAWTPVVPRQASDPRWSSSWPPATRTPSRSEPSMPRAMSAHGSRRRCCVPADLGYQHPPRSRPVMANGRSSTALGGSVAYTTTASDRRSLVRGPRRGLGRRSPRRGAAVVVVDGVDERSVDLVATEMEPRRLVATRVWSESAPTPSTSARWARPTDLGWISMRSRSSWRRPGSLRRPSGSRVFTALAGSDRRRDAREA